MQKIKAVDTLNGPKAKAPIPEKWMDLFNWFEAHPMEPLAVEAESEEEAISWRYRFYQVRQRLALQEHAPTHISTLARKAKVNGNQVLVYIGTCSEQKLAKLMVEAKEAVQS